MIKVGIVGGTGYTGVELLRLLVTHPEVEITAITSRSEAGKSVADIFPSLRGQLDIQFSEPDLSILTTCDLVFFATPNGTAMTMVPALLDTGVKIIDLAADFRLKDPDEWQLWYGQKHSCPELLSDAVYGLPEMNRERIRDAQIVANPGCYPTATILGFLPLIEKGIVDGSNLIVDAKSGVSGAGRGAKVDTLLCEASESFKAYAVTGHRHLPEIRQALVVASGIPIGLTFVPHLTPMIRGIHATLYAKLNNADTTLADIQKLYEDRYVEETFVDVMPGGSHPETRSVKGANYCRVAIHQPQNRDTIVVLSVIDNLVKGAAGQAVQNMNIMFGVEERAGLEFAPFMP
jgi:N-acetyl-gamma-glutamyl-phosphate reductase